MVWFWYRSPNDSVCLAFSSAPKMEISSKYIHLLMSGVYFIFRCHLDLSFPFKRRQMTRTQDARFCNAPQHKADFCIRPSSVQDTFGSHSVGQFSQQNISYHQESKAKYKLLSYYMFTIKLMWGNWQSGKVTKFHQNRSVWHLFALSIPEEIRCRGWAAQRSAKKPNFRLAVCIINRVLCVVGCGMRTYK